MPSNWDTTIKEIKEEDFIVEKIESGIHPINFLVELNRLYGNGRTVDAVRNKFYRMTGKKLSNCVRGTSQELDDFGNTLSYETLYPQLESLAARENIYKTFDDGKDHKIFFMSDLEIPYQHTEYIRSAVNYAIKEKCTDLVIGGDFFHAYAFSKFVRDKDISLADEMRVAQNFINEVKGKFKNIVFILGNHDARVINTLKGRLDNLYPSMKYLFKDEDGDVLNIFCNENGVMYSKTWWVQIGEIIFSHRFPYSSVYAKNMTSSVDWFLARLPKGIDASWDEDDSLHVRPFRALAQGHSHRLLSGGMYKQVYLYESGCMCREIDFNLRGNQTQPIWMRGFGIFTLVNNKILFNSSRVYEAKTIRNVPV